MGFNRLAFLLAFRRALLRSRPFIGGPQRLGFVAVVFCLLLGAFLGLKGQAPGLTGSPIGVQQSGTFKGAAMTLNCSTNMTCTLSGAVVSISAAGGCAAIGSPTANAVLFDNGSGCPADATNAATIPGLTIQSGSLTMSGNQSAPAWTTSGVRFKNVPATFTDTTSNGTVATAYTNVFGGSTIAASSATTYTNYFNSYFNAPIAGSMVTFTNGYALGADSIKSAAMTNSALTSGRLVLSGTGGLETDDQGLTYSGTGSSFVLNVCPGPGAGANCGLTIGRTTNGTGNLRNTNTETRLYVSDSATALDIGSNGTPTDSLTTINGGLGVNLAPKAGKNIGLQAHAVASGTAPTITSGFGTSSSLEAGSNDLSGRINVGTGGIAATGVLTFATAFSTAPSCAATDESTVLLVQCTATTTTLTLTSAIPWTASDKITWTTLGH